MRHLCRLFRSDFLARCFLVDATKVLETFGRDLVAGGWHAGIVSKSPTIYRPGIMPQRHIPQNAAIRRLLRSEAAFRMPLPLWK